MDDRLRAAVAASHLRGLPDELLRELLADARRLRVPAGQELHRAGEDRRHVELVLRGQHQRDAVLVARITQQDLADAVGTVREVVVRTLRELRHERLVETGRTGIVITAPERLLAEAYPEWNSGP